MPTLRNRLYLLDTISSDSNVKVCVYCFQIDVNKNIFVSFISHETDRLMMERITYVVPCTSQE